LPPPWAVVRILCAWLVGPVGAVCGHEFATRVEADEGQVSNGHLHVLHVQFIGPIAVRMHLGQFVDDSGCFLVVPARTLTRTALAEGHDKVCVPTVDYRVEVSGNTASWPVAGNFKVTG